MKLLEWSRRGPLRNFRARSIISRAGACYVLLGIMRTGVVKQMLKSTQSNHNTSDMNIKNNIVVQLKQLHCIISTKMYE